MFIEQLGCDDIKEYLMGLTYFKERNLEVKVESSKEVGVYQITIIENENPVTFSIVFEDMILFGVYYTRIPVQYEIEKNSWQLFLVKRFGNCYIRWYIEEEQKEHDKIIKSLNEEHARRMKRIMYHFERAKAEKKI